MRSNYYFGSTESVFADFGGVVGSAVVALRSEIIGVGSSCSCLAHKAMVFLGYIWVISLFTHATTLREIPGHFALSITKYVFLSVALAAVLLFQSIRHLELLKPLYSKGIMWLVLLILKFLV